MDAKELAKLRPALERFASEFDCCIKTRPSRRHFERYLNGQLGPLERKSVEPIALDAGVPPRSLQEFLSIHRWDHNAALQRMRHLAQRDHGADEAVAVIDETGFVKKGNKTPGVQRQYCGAVGKTENCVVTVHLGYVTPSFHCLVDGDLYLPKSWDEDRSRCRNAGIDDDVVHRPKWRIGLDILGRSLAGGLRLRWLTADEEYGRSTQFRDGVAEMGLTYVVEVPTGLHGWTRAPEVQPAGAATRAGRILKKARVAPGQRKSRPVSGLWKRGGPSWHLFRVKDTQKGPLVWKVRESRFFPNRGGVPGKELRIVVARNVLTGEVKYFLSNAPTETPLEQLLAVAFARWHIERLFEDAKGEVGLDHFEVRTYRSLIRHIILSMISLYFLADQTSRLRGGKPVVDYPPGQGRGRGATRLHHHAA